MDTNVIKGMAIGGAIGVAVAEVGRGLIGARRNSAAGLAPFPALIIGSAIGAWWVSQPENSDDTIKKFFPQPKGVPFNF